MRTSKIKVRSASSFRILNVVSILLVLLIASGVMSQEVPAESGTRADERPIRTLRDLNQAFVDIVSKVKPAVVTVSTERIIYVRPMSPFSGDPFFRFFFGPQGRQAPEQEYRQRGLGSGVIVSADGHILTNNHVIENADSIFVRTYDGERFTAQVVGTDPQTDIAVIKIDDSNLHFINIGNSDALQVGEIVLAVGSPMSENLAYTVTQGIVSAKGRADVGLATYEDFIQTDAAINPGNSGGPLVNLDGELVGINAAIVSQTGGFQGIGFAVPSNMAVRVMNSLITEGRVSRAWLGINIQDVNEQIAGAMGLDEPVGALIGDVVSGSPADKAGLQPGDIVLDFSGRRIENAHELRSLIGSSPPGKNITMQVLRGDNKLNLNATLSEMPMEVGETPAERDLQSLLGFAVATLDDRLANRYGIDRHLSGAVVVSIDGDSQAYQQGLREGDLIRAVNRARVNNKEQFLQAVSRLEEGSSVLLRLYRNGNGYYLAFVL